MTKQDSRQFMHRLAPKEDSEQGEQQKLHRGDQHSLHSRQLLLFQHRQHADFLQQDKKLVEQPCFAQFVDLFNFFSRIQCLGDLPIIT